MVLVSKILAIAFAASLYPKSTGLACLLHAIIKFIIIEFYEKPSENCLAFNNKFKRYFLFSVYGLISNFHFISLNDEPTFMRHTIYYLINFIEILVSCGVFYNIDLHNYSIWFIFSPIYLFLLGILFMCFYYHFLHPNKNNIHNNTQNIYYKLYTQIM